ncbi:Histidinol-phosphate aminotransferase [Golovinomyces cichoracearum]|uniref:histidinol-phosphate transaminase n=1 Tax=Golovinomyces cichoracearum TaxID=62708 RepID=A0A420HDV6_9PEZI|nr:Histidinol-phosphate aminotransferase [Golovinomyces cichoracearum]
MAEKKNGFNLETCARPNILSLEPYRCARDDFKDDGTNILLDANENAYGSSVLPPQSLVSSEIKEGSLVKFARLHRYPDPHQHELKQCFCDLRNTHIHTKKKLTPENLFLGVGSDEAIDVLIRCFCVPGTDRILICPPTYGMYSICAQVNDVGLVKVPLLPSAEFSIDVHSIISVLASPDSAQIKIIFICSPGNPTGSLIKKEDIQRILEHQTWNGIVVIDEAYIDFAPEGYSLAEMVVEWPNLVVMQTLSKAFGLAGIRLGVAFTSCPIATLLNNLKAPYNISRLTSEIALKALNPVGLSLMRSNKQKLDSQKERLLKELPRMKGIGMFRGGKSCNFLLVEILDSKGKANNATALNVYERLAKETFVVVRFRGKENGCNGCLRITIGTDAEVTALLEKLTDVINQVHAEEIKPLK